VFNAAMVSAKTCIVLHHIQDEIDAAMTAQANVVE